MKIVKVEMFFFCPDSMVEEIVNSVDPFMESFECPSYSEVSQADLLEGIK